MNKPARYNHFWAQRRSKCALCMIFNGLSRNTFNADAIFFPGDPYISRTTVLDNIYPLRACTSRLTLMMASLSKYRVVNSSTIYCNVFLSDITHLNEIERVLVASHFAKTRWFSLGLKLGLYKTTLDAIEDKHKNEVDRCLLECLSAWLDKVNNVRSEGDPNWILLTSALREIDQNAVADNVDQ